MKKVIWILMVLAMLVCANTFYSLATKVVCGLMVLIMWMLVEQASFEHWLDNKDAYKKARNTKNPEDPIFVGERLGHSGWYKIYKTAGEVVAKYHQLQEARIIWYGIILVALVATNGFFYLGKWLHTFL